MHDVLEIDMTDSRLMRRLAEHINHEEIFPLHFYSVDAHLTNAFSSRKTFLRLTTYIGFQDQFTVIEQVTEWPNRLN